MATRILRPLDYGGILDETFDLYKKHFKVLVGIAAVLYIPMYVLCFGLFGEAAGNIVLSLLTPLQFLVMAATTWAVSRVYLGESITIAGAYKAVWRRGIALFFTLFLAFLYIYLGILACIVPGVMLMFRYAFISEVFVLEGLSGKDARVRSTLLAKDHYLRIFVVAAISTIIMWIVTGILVFPIGMITSSTAMTGSSYALGVLSGLVQGVASALASPIQVLALVILYYDIRVRKEGFDIEMLAQNMKQNTDSAAAPEEVKTL